MADYLQVGGLQVAVEYKRIKHLRLTVYPPEGKIKISAPVYCTTRDIEQFITSKRDWIEKHRQKYQRHANIKNLSLESGEHHYVWGIPCVLEVIEKKGNPRIEKEGQSIKLFVRPNTEKKKKAEIMDTWYRSLIQEAAPQFVAKWEPCIGVKVKGIYYRKMKSHWGSCNYSSQTIRLNTELAKKSPECLEYVIIHEMVHILEPSHNRHFYEIMNKWYPSWKDIRKKMNSGEL
ncbi:M48 family metallopeptidase [Breznakiella homolactica]|uniref:M48 family metallopeptidase n=1 Tax=Breznakiella homolactica TaxID=2798577 RepID=A0A7T8BBR5_9SPIR|nr:SprT family zinc-dependent metalloprotease [Breznakiella homolactica]QQO09483.1 M48 family metallopeptidase [Breznakiella homolactica]